MTDWRTWLTIALVGAPCLGYVVLCIADAEGRRETGRSPLASAAAWVRAQWHRLRHDPDPYAPEFAEAPDPVDAHADTVPVERAEWWTGQRLGGYRLSEGWIAYAESEFDWHAAEYMVRRVR